MMQLVPCSEHGPGNRHVHLTVSHSLMLRDSYPHARGTAEVQRPLIKGLWSQLEVLESFSTEKKVAKSPNILWPQFLTQKMGSDDALNYVGQRWLAWLVTQEC